MKKLTITSDSLKPALAKLSQAVNIKNPLPALVNVYCKVTPNQIELIGTDTEITILYRLECESIESFDFLLPFEFLTKIVALSKGFILEIEAGKVVKIKCNSDVYEVKPNSKLTEFPKLQEFPLSNINTFSNDVLKSLNTAIATTTTFGKAVFAFVVLDVYKNKLIVASTDSNCLYSLEFQNENGLLETSKEFERLLFSQKAIKSLAGLDEVKICFNDTTMGFDGGNIRVIVVRNNEKFPDYDKIFPQEFKPNFFINRFQFIDALQKCSLSSDSLKTTKIDFSKSSTIKLTAKDDMLNIDVEIDAKHSIEELNEITINSDRFLKILHQTELVDIDITIQGIGRPMLITSKELTGYKSMIMPIFQN